MVFQSSSCLVFVSVLCKNVAYDQAGKCLAKGSNTSSKKILLFSFHRVVEEGLATAS